MRFPKERVASFLCSFGAADRSTYSILGTEGSITLDPGYEFAEGLAYSLRIGGRTHRPGLEQEIRRPGIQPPRLVHASQPSA